MSKTKLDIEDFVYMSVICEATSVRSSVGLKYQLQSVTKFHAESFGQITVWRYFVLRPQWGSGPYICRNRNFLIRTHFVNAPWKNRIYASTFPAQRKEINVVKVRFTIRSSSRKLSNEKVMTTACNVWRQIACFFWVKRGNVLLLGKIFEIPPFFQTRPGDLGKKEYACSLRFSALKSQVGGNLLSQIAKMADRSFADRVVLPVTAAIYRNGEEKPVLRE